MLASIVALALAVQGRGPVDLPADAGPSRTIDDWAIPTGLTPLRRQPIPKNDLEFRFWYGFDGATYVSQLRRTSGRWAAHRSEFIPRPGSGDGDELAYREIAPPKRGWNAVWLELKALDVLTIPDEASLPDDGIAIADGSCYLFEIRRGDAYRSYFYNNPDEHPTKTPTVKILKMVRVLQSVFFPREV